VSTLRLSSPVKLIASVIYHNPEIAYEALERLSQLFGKMDFISEVLPFTHTQYYYPEMGKPLFRRFVSFQELIYPGQLPKIKINTNALEQNYALDGKRQVNIDPGYLTPERLILATGKNYTHRVYLKDGVYADLTLIYQKGDFQDLPWTYPDYATKQVKEILKLIRKKYLYQRKGR